MYNKYKYEEPGRCICYQYGGFTLSLQDILGRTAEVRIIDFLAENFGNSYTQWEIFQLTGISRNVLYKKLPEMVEKNILAIEGEVGTHRTYRLADNGVVNKLIALIYEYNLKESEKPDEETTKIMAREDSPSGNRYYKDPKVLPDELAVLPTIIKERSIPLEYEQSPKSTVSESVKKIELKEQYSKAISAESA
jgi:hypothetical protein